jgi:hypothetical protein
MPYVRVHKPLKYIAYLLRQQGGGGASFYLKTFLSLNDSQEKAKLFNYGMHDGK